MTARNSKLFPPVFFLILFAALTLLYYPTFNNPPRSDYWTAYYHFHQVAASPEPLAWIALCNYDPWEHGTFRPVSHLILYLQFRLFNPWFTGNRLTNFSLYLLTILLLFMLAQQLGLDTVLTAAFLGVYAFLYSHFDIVTWTFQIYTTSSFCAFLFGFILYIRYIRTEKDLLLLPAGALFLYAMFSAEAYTLWPLAILIPGLGARRLFPEPPPSRKRLLKLSGTMLASVYLLYGFAFILARTADTVTGPLPRPSLALAATAAAGIFFNLAYTGFLVNLLPFVTEPTVFKDNIDMGGLLVRWYDPLPSIIIWTGLGTFLLIALAAAILYRKKKFRTLLILSFLFFLYSSFLFILTLARLTTNEHRYVFSQFRYQYIPNGLLALILAAALGKSIRRKRKNLFRVLAPLLVILAVNLLYTRKYISIINQQLRPLAVMLGNIQAAVAEGRINAEAPLFIDDEVTGALPELCWNNDMAGFMEHSYQWFFPPDWMPYFSFSPGGAAWVIEPENPEIISPVGRNFN